MKIALITDQHIGVRNDSKQFHEYFAKFYTEFFFPKILDQDIRTVICLGDLFDRRKYINFDSLHRSRDYLFEPLHQNGIKFHCLVGNHDIYYKNTNRVNSPELLLKEYENVIQYSSPSTVEFDNLKVLMMPWINNENYEECMEIARSTSASVMMSHLELAGFEMYRGAVNDHGLSHKEFSNFDYVFSGHFHHKSTKDNVHYLGAPYEMTWSDYDDDRGFHIFDTETRELEYLRNPFRMFHKVFYNDVNQEETNKLPDFSHLKDCYVKVIVKQKDNPYLFDLYMDSLNSSSPAHVQVVEDNFNLDIEEDDSIIDEAEDTVSIIKKYVKNLNLEDSKPIEQLFYDLYQDALSIE